MLLVYVLCLAVIFPSARIFTTPPLPLLLLLSYGVIYCETSSAHLSACPVDVVCHCFCLMLPATYMQPLVLLHSLPLRPFPLLISSGIISSLMSSGIIYVISWLQKYYAIWTLLPGQPCSPELCALRLPSASYFVWWSLLSNVIVSFLGVSCGCRLSLPMFSLASCLAPAFCFFFRMVLSIVKRPRLICRRVLWMSFVSASVCFCLIHTCQPLVLLHPFHLGATWPAEHASGG